jgi:N-acetylmuramoyl-L-alanine amidase
MTALLTENGFIDNANDAAKLKDANFLMTIAAGHANGLAKAFNLTGKSPVLYKVQIGAFGNKTNAYNLAADANSKGFDAIVYKE